MNKEQYNKIIREEAKKFKITAEDLHNLFDMFYMIDYGTLRANNMLDWANNFSGKLDKIILCDIKPIKNKKVEALLKQFKEQKE